MSDPQIVEETSGYYYKIPTTPIGEFRLIR